jgi:hypothetical protein
MSSDFEPLSSLSGNDTPPGEVAREVREERHAVGLGFLAVLLIIMLLMGAAAIAYGLATGVLPADDDVGERTTAT